MWSLSSTAKDLPEEILSAVVVESAKRFEGASVTQLLDPQSAVNHLLSCGTLFYNLVWLFNHQSRFSMFTGLSAFFSQ